MTTTRRVERELIFLLYWLIRIAAFPLLILYLLLRGIRDRGYFGTFAERFGRLPESFDRTPPGGVWLHAVSVGEVLSAAPLIRELRARLPLLPVYLSTTTLAGRAVADEKLRGIASGVFCAPIDYGFAISGVLQRIRPAAVVILETEIWPLLYRRVKEAGCGLLVLNGRISDRALPRYRAASWFFRHVLSYPDSIRVQSSADRERYILAGAPASKVTAGGNLKYDVPPAPAPPRALTALLETLRPSAIWIAASTMGPSRPGDVDEDDIVIDAFRQAAKGTPNLLLILAPRKPERFDVVAGKLRSAGLSWMRRSNHDGAALPLPGVLLLDSIGELAGLFHFADAVFMGGTLADRGGHNILEPAVAARACITGPHMENFAAIAAEFRTGGAMIPIEEPGELAGAVMNLLSDRNAREQIGLRAQALARARRGAAEQAVAAILNARDEAIPYWRGRGPAYPLMWLLAQVWSFGSAVLQRQKQAQQRRLGTPVISIGGITMGGTGKTPFAAVTSEILREQGLRPAILTRGYRRRSLARSVIVCAGDGLPADVTGDEAQILIEPGAADVGIGADRYETARLLESACAPDVFLLDDGFQHRRLYRDSDLVLIDSLDPFSRGDVFPAGRLREPLSTLARASAFVITRVEEGRQYSGIRAILEKYNPGAPVFRARVEPREWVDLVSGAAVSMPPNMAAAAFCGLGNPATFWRTLSNLGVQIRWRWSFDDHHRYKSAELKRLAAQARRIGTTLLLTTQKDAANLPENAARLVAPARILWLRIETVLEERDEFVEFLRRALRIASDGSGASRPSLK